MPATTSAQPIHASTGFDPGMAAAGAEADVIGRFRGELLNQALAITGHIEDAEDAVQETLCEALRARSKMDALKSPLAWLRSINRANALDILRRKGSEAAGSARKKREAPGRSATTGGFSLLEVRESVAQAIETLPDNLRAAVVLHFWEHLSCEEVARRLRIPVGTVKWRLADAAIRLHGRLGRFFQAQGGKAP